MTAHRSVPTLLVVLVVSVLLAAAPAVAGAPQMVRKTTARAGRSAEIDLLAGGAKVCSARFAGPRKTVAGPFRRVVRGPYVRLKWSVPKNAKRSKWTLRVACGRSRRKPSSLGAVKARIRVRERRSRRAALTIVKRGSFRIRSGPLPAAGTQGGPGQVGGAVGTPPGSQPVGSAARLPFKMPSASVLRASSRLVFAHYHPQYVISQDNQPPLQDMYATNYLNPNGFGGAYKPFGGYARDRPLPRNPLGGNWELTDMETEVAACGERRDRRLHRQRRRADQRLHPGSHQAPDGCRPDRLARLQDHPDARRVRASRRRPTTLAQRVHALDSNPALFRLGDGRLVISPWAPEKQGVSYWSSFKSALQALGTSTALVPTFIDIYDNATAFAGISYGMGTWGGRSPAGASAPPTSTSRRPTSSTASGKVYMQAVSAQDARPTQQIYWEANNTENLRYTWNSAIAGADWVQMATWNDYGEGTEFSPSVDAGSTLLDISSYYLARFKTGASPRIVDSGAYVTHRIQLAGATPDPAAGNTSLMKPNFATGQSVRPRDTVEVLTFLTAGANITVTVGAPPIATSPRPASRPASSR